VLAPDFGCCGRPLISKGFLDEAGRRAAQTVRALAPFVERGVPIVAMSGIIGGVALKGPADRMLASLGHESSALGVARLYRGVATAFVADAVDAAAVPAIGALGLRATAFDTVMSDDTARTRVAGDLLRWIG